MRDVPHTLNACQHEFQEAAAIDVAKARFQHQHYRQLLESAGVIVGLLAADPIFPDCCFIEDTAVIIDDTLVICRPGAPSRQGEVDAVRDCFIDCRYQIVELPDAARLDGGDVLQIEHQIYVGISRRTNRAGFDVIADVARQHGRNAFAIEVRSALHLKSACTYLGRGSIVGLQDRLGEGRDRLDRYRFHSADREPAAANVSLVNGCIFIPAQCVRTIDQLIIDGFDVVPVDISELQKAEAGPTCLTILGN